VALAAGSGPLDRLSAVCAAPLGARSPDCTGRVGACQGCWPVGRGL